MKIPSRLIPLVEDGIIDDVLGQVKSGKEADVFIVQVGDEVRCAKVYKEANQRSFRQAAVYQEGRKVQNSRSARAIAKSTRFGKKEAENSWISAEVAALNTLSAAGIRVPTPYGFFDGVLIMELILGEDGLPAPRLNDLTLSAETALLYHEELISQIVRMLCAGIIHGDLSEFNVLVDTEGPVIIDLPQAVNAAGNNSAAMLFARDVDNMARWFGRFEPGILGLKYAKEIWALYEKRKLTPETELTGRFTEPTRAADVGGVLDAIGDARKEHEDKLLRKAGERVPRAWDREAGKPQDRNPGFGNPGPGSERGKPQGNRPPRTNRQDPQRGRPHGQSQRPQANPPPPSSRPPSRPSSQPPPPQSPRPPVPPPAKPPREWGRR
ncbi:MAG: serine protein kinase RIO [Fibrobacteres bacterium]|nr:serine protein kinase RIO [Fibrobacterota bacterium]